MSEVAQQAVGEKKRKQKKENNNKNNPKLNPKRNTTHPPTPQKKSQTLTKPHHCYGKNNNNIESLFHPGCFISKRALEPGEAGLAPGSAAAPVAADGRGAVALYPRRGKG